MEYSCLRNGLRNWLGVDQAGRNRAVPRLRLFRNCSNPTPPLEPKEEREGFGRRWDSVQEFFAHWKTNSDGTFKSYSNLQEFEELFRGEFRDFLEGQIDQETGQKLLNRKVHRWKSSPFRGLNVFDFEHAPIFHGRTGAIGGVLEALEGSERNGLLCWSWVRAALEKVRWSGRACFHY